MKTTCSEELQFHLEREAERLEAAGLPPETARLQALRLFGGAEQIRDECRDARGIAFVEDTVRDFFYALRAFKRAPLVAFTIVSTVALGLGLVTAVFTVLNALVFRVDAVPDVQELFAVERPQTVGEPARFTREQFRRAPARDQRVQRRLCTVNDVDGRMDGRLIYGTFVTGNSFQVLRVSAAMGRALTPADDEPSAGQAVMVLSHRGWDRLFARNPAVIGRRVLVNGLTFEIVGVMPEGFRGLAVIASDDYWAPLSMLGQVSPMHKGREATVGLDIIGRLKPGLSREVGAAQLAAWDAAQSSGSSPIDQGGSRITLVPRRGTVPQPLEAVPVTGPLFFAFGLILLIGCANVANLLLARAVARQREIGIQLSLGATRRRIVRQLMTESLLLALIAAAAGFLISRVALAVIVNALMTSMPPDIGDVRLLIPDADWRVLLFILAGAVVSTIAFALAPALQATRIEPIRTMRGEVVRDARPGRARNFLIGLQVSASALLLISAAVFLRSAFAGASHDTGVRTSDTVAVQIVNEQSARRVSEGGNGRTLGRRRGRVVAGAGTPGGFRGDGQRQNEARIPVRLAGVLSRAGHCGPAGARVHAGREHTESFGGRRFRDDGANDVAECRSDRPNDSARPGTGRTATWRRRRSAARRRSRSSNRERSRWPASSETSRGCGSRRSRRQSSTCRRVPRCPGHHSSRASTAIRSWQGRRCSTN